MPTTDVHFEYHGTPEALLLTISIRSRLPRWREAYGCRNGVRVDDRSHADAHEYQPEFRRYLLNFPKATFPDSTNFLYWQVTQFALKPTVRISHLVIRENPEETVAASKMLKTLRGS